MEDFERYYLAQAGSGLSGFSGVRYQRGNGFFGRLLSGSVFPLLKFLGKNLLKTGVNVASDLLETDDFSLSNIKNTAKTNVKKQAGDILETAMSKMKGSGKRRRRKAVDPVALAKYYRAKIRSRKKKKTKRKKRIKGGRKRRKCQRKEPTSYSGEFLF